MVPEGALGKRRHRETQQREGWFSRVALAASRRFQGTPSLGGVSAAPERPGVPEEPILRWSSWPRWGCASGEQAERSPLPWDPQGAVTGRSRSALPSASLSTAFLFLLCFPALLQARRAQRAARARTSPTTTGTPKMRRVLGRSAEGTAGAKAEVGSMWAGSAVGRDVGSVRRGRAGVGEGGQQRHPPTHLATLGAAAAGEKSGSLPLLPTHHPPQTVPLPDGTLIPPAAVPGWWEMRASCSSHGHLWGGLRPLRQAGSSLFSLHHVPLVGTVCPLPLSSCSSSR